MTEVATAASIFGFGRMLFPFLLVDCFPRIHRLCISVQCIHLDCYIPRHWNKRIVSEFHLPTAARCTVCCEPLRIVRQVEIASNNPLFNSSPVSITILLIISLIYIMAIGDGSFEMAQSNVARFTDRQSIASSPL